jgi:hypothetical protein
MGRNTVQEKTPDKLPVLAADSIPLDTVRRGRTWRNVRAEVVADLDGFPKPVIDQELEEAAELFMRGPLPAARARQEALKEAVASVPADERSRVYATFTSEWV